MTIDERLEKLAERQQALLEMVKRMARERQQRKPGRDPMKVRIDEVLEATARLLHIAQIHEHRITRLEGQQ
jgi:hypothetical protein